MKKRNIKLTVIVIIIFYFLSIDNNCIILSQQKKLTNDQQRLNIESFEYAWKTIYEQFFDSTFNGVNWRGVYDELKPKIDTASTMQKARAIIEDMLNRLRVSHFNLIPFELYTYFDQPNSKYSRNGTTGITVRMVDGHALITKVDKNSEAEKAGVKCGWELIRINKHELVNLFIETQKEYKWERKDFIENYVSNSYLNGNTGDTLAIQLLDESYDTVNLKILMGRKKGDIFCEKDFLPHFVWIDTLTISEKIGYISFNAFLNNKTILETFNKALKTYSNYNGIIIDLRGNSGGHTLVEQSMMTWFLNEKSNHLGTVYTRKTESKIFLPGRYNAYKGLLAVLVDVLSESASEFFAGFLQDIGRAKILGSKTHGAILVGKLEKLPNGDGFMFPYANIKTKSGKMLEGNGVIPDFEVQYTRESLLQEKDLVLEAAIDWIKNNTDFKLINK